VAPACADPAPLLGMYDPRAPGYGVLYYPAIDAVATTAELARRYGFAPRYVYDSLPGFAALLSPQAVAGIRCERTVKLVEYDSVVTLF